MKKEDLTKYEEISKKFKNKIIRLSDFTLLLEEKIVGTKNTQKCYKITHELKNKGHLLSIKKDILFITDPQDPKSEEEIEELFYWKIVKEHCQKFCGSHYYIGGLTALELHSQGTGIGIPEEIHIINKHKQSVEIVMFDKRINFKTLESRKKNLYPLLSKFTQKIRIKGNAISHANLELAVLDVLYANSLSNQGYIEGLIKKLLKKNKKAFSIEQIEQILKQGKYNSSANKLLSLLKEVNGEKADQLEQIIKKHGYLL
ncbi:MAG: hypothetical protein PHU61_03715 [Candidatus Absconditabacteria bacterium]|nr:hypothetical protein [Candidatus Absconditabacteria bacterium]MDD3868358.1 hypothetical protein [Candidatus Absconditabacteria bacterium]MDD4714439.1 hypothetical protein [Candidatus Absconditabacteria bacterium]